MVVREQRRRFMQRIRREIRRVGLLRFSDVVAFRIYYRLALAARDHTWTDERLRELFHRYGDVPESCQIFETVNPNTADVLKLLHDVQPDLILARCKNILREETFTAASKGTFVMHPGVCPEYRNAHGCFWALVRRDLNNVGMTLLRVDSGVDTGPVYGYYRCAFDEKNESHIIIQNRVVFDNLESLRVKFDEIANGSARPIEVSGRKSQAWGQPWLTSHLKWKHAARKTVEEHARTYTSVS